MHKQKIRAVVMGQAYRPLFSWVSGPSLLGGTLRLFFLSFRDPDLYIGCKRRQVRWRKRQSLRGALRLRGTTTHDDLLAILVNHQDAPLIRKDIS